MEREEYIKKKKELKKTHDAQMYELAKEYVFSNTDIKVGDIVYDHIGCIKVEKVTIGYGFNRDYPDVVLAGYCYVSDGSRPFKNKSYRNIWGGNIITK